MNEDQKKLLIIQNIIDTNEAYRKKFLNPVCAHLMEAALINERDFLKIKQVLQGNFNI